MNELIHFSLKRRFGNGAQILLNIILIVLIGCAVFADRIIDFINPDMLEPPTVYLADLDENVKEFLLSQNSTLFHFEEWKHQKAKGTSSYILEQQNTYTLKSQYKVEPAMKEALTAMIAQARQTAILNETQGQNEMLNAYITPITMKNQITDKQTNHNEQQSNMTFMVITGIYFMMISFATTVANEVVYEKATKTLELILTSVSARTHFISKIIVGWLVVLFQCLSICVYTGFWLLVRNFYDQGTGLLKVIDQLHLASISQRTFGSFLSSLSVHGDLLVKLMFIFLFLFAGILLIQLLMVIVSSFISNIEEAGNIQAPFYIIMLIVYYLAISLNTPYHLNEGIGYYFSFIPFLSMLFMPCRILQGSVSFYELGLSFFFACSAFFMLAKSGSHIYQKGVLDYSSKGLLHILRQLKNT